MDTKEAISVKLNSNYYTKEDNNDVREKRLWKEISSPFCSIQEALDHLSKDELSEIRKHHDFKNMSSLKKKELIDELAKKLPESLFDFMNKVDEGRYQLFKVISENNGVLVVDEYDLFEIESWRRTGFIFSAISDGHRVLFIPQEILEAFLSLNDTDMYEIIHRNTIWILLTQGMLHYYGIMKLDEISNKIYDLTGSKPEQSTLNNILQKAHEFYRVIKPGPNGYWANSEVPNINDILKEHTTRSSIDFANFSKYELLQAGRPGFIDENNAFKRFESFLINEFDLPKFEAKRITLDTQKFIKSEPIPTAVIDYLSTQLKFSAYEVIQRLADEAMYLMNNTRQWVIKGYTPSELRDLERKASISSTQPLNRSHKKIGRNAPCPCGSNKKFKHCCGK